MIPTVTMDHEAFLAGALLIDAKRTLRDTRGLLTPDSFTNSTYRALFEAALELEADQQSIDPVVLCKAVERSGLELPFAEAKELMALVPSLEAVNFYGERIAEAEDTRNMRNMLLDAYERLTNGENMGMVRSEVERELAALKLRGSAALIDSMSAMSNAYQQLIDSSAGKNLFVGTGYGKLNKILGGGFIKSGLHILAARPGTGKTTLALQIAENVAAKGVKTLFITLEMSVEQLQHRRIAVEAGLSLADILHVAPEDETTWGKISAAVGKLNQRPLYFNRMPGLSIQRIERLARTSEAGFLVIDYLGLISHSGGKSIYEKVTETSNALKRMAVSLGIPVLCLCQLNRGADGHAPALSELRDSGAIEQDADTVMLQWLPGGRREAEGNTYSPVGLEVLVAKNRHGTQGKVPLDWYMNCGRIRE